MRENLETLERDLTKIKNLQGEKETEYLESCILYLRNKIKELGND